MTRRERIEIAACKALIVLSFVAGAAAPALAVAFLSGGPS